ncbi:histone-lysine N-methyltransferase ATX3-like isoform X2 [Oryza brachyantha]|uniref:Histone-lysine N-methyltransferase n=1 Tax=Oryza brachyantha TaxID=4533 RepID=J3KXP8_ORYBR|nr:histone-lysine N-methyltransferase ATX3-like isoform X2 [Oryza brachyantha]
MQPPAKRRRERVVPSRFRDSVVAVPTAARKGRPAGAVDGELYDLEAPEGEPSVAACAGGDEHPAPTEEELYWACRNIRRSSTSGCSSGSVVTTALSNGGGNGWRKPRRGGGDRKEDLCCPCRPEGKATVVECKRKSEGGEKKDDFYWPEDFALGDVVWARAGKKCPAWPALVIDPLQHAPAVVLNSCIPGALCVMFFGYSYSGLRDYGWVKQGMIYPFMEYLDRFQGQPLHKIKASRFSEAIEEAFLAERGSFELEMDGLQEGTGSNNEQECQLEALVFGKSPGCDSCGNRLLCKIANKKKQAGEQLLCRHCDKLLQSKQYCGICKKIWHHTDGGNWVCCDECEIWVHVECDQTCINMEDLENADYFCPDCKSKR